MTNVSANLLPGYRHLDLSILRSFVLIADGRSFGETAVIMDRSPSAITLQIQKLECFLGARLLNRSGRAISLTKAGEALVNDARLLLDGNDRMLASFSERLLKIAPTMDATQTSSC
ncbi:MAG: LysR family transcriptional regulator [Pseudomonadota bacterium]|nr:LysR family transcriptional regulator [Pseudomonadota bacterium]